VGNGRTQTSDSGRTGALDALSSNIILQRGPLSGHDMDILTRYCHDL
jgi:hypothetical protein